MVTQQSQIKLNLPLSLKEYLESRAQRFGMPLAGYVKYLILKDVDDMDYPTFEASDRTNTKAEQAVKSKKESLVVEDIHRLFSDLK